jgi:hypothetical protein
MKAYETPSVVSLEPVHGAATAGSQEFYITAAFMIGFHKGLLTADPQRLWHPGRPAGGCTIARRYKGFNWDGSKETAAEARKG